MQFFSLKEGFTPVTRRGRRTTISPDDHNQRINLDDAFAAIDPCHQSNSDDDQSSQDSNQSVTLDDDSEYGIGNMTIINRKGLADIMVMVVLMAEPTMDLQNARKKVANALFT